MGESVSLGLYAYPVLMAADILLYDADLVPVGEDQTQHIELTKDICRHFNSLYGKKSIDKKTKREVRESVLREPKGVILQECARVMSLQDGSSKMSKSSDNDMSRINLLDPPDLLSKKIKRCKTDAIIGLSVDDDSRPESRNLVQLYVALEEMNSPSSSPEERLARRKRLLSELSTMSWGVFKPRLTDALIAHLQPIQSNYARIEADRGYLEGVLSKGRERANAAAEVTLDRAKKALGIYS